MEQDGIQHTTFHPKAVFYQGSVGNIRRGLLKLLKRIPTQVPKTLPKLIFSH